MPKGTAAAGTGMIRDLYRYVWKVSGRNQVLLSLLAVALFLLELVPLELQRRIVNVAVAKQEFHAIALLCLAYLAAVLVQGGTKLVLNVFRGSVSESANQRLRSEANLIAMASTPDRGEAKDEGAAISIVVSEVEAVGGFVGTSFSEPLLNGGMLLSVFGYMLVIEPWLALVAIGLFLPQTLFIPILQRAINRRTKKRIETLRAISTQIVDEADDKAATRKKRYLGQVRTVYDLNMQIFRRKFGMNFLMNLLHHFGIVGLLFVGGWLFLAGQTEMGTVVAFISGLNRMNDPWGDLVNFFRDLSNTAVKYRMITTALGKRAAPA
jgi:ABC-type multidrug transport system fused ATPase/permease subunit